jgi:hypothetical protein
MYMAWQFVSPVVATLRLKLGVLSPALLPLAGGTSNTDQTAHALCNRVLILVPSFALDTRRKVGRYNWKMWKHQAVTTWPFGQSLIRQTMAGLIPGKRKGDIGGFLLCPPGRMGQKLMCVGDVLGISKDTLRLRPHGVALRLWDRGIDTRITAHFCSKNQSLQLMPQGRDESEKIAD